MSTRRIRTPGNLPVTRLYCDWYEAGNYCQVVSFPPEGYNAYEVRRDARPYGWERIDRKDYCPKHAPMMKEEA